MDTGKPSTSSNEPSEGSTTPLTRRDFLCVSSACAFTAVATSPEARAAWGDPIAAGVLRDYTADEISEKYVQHDFFLIRNKDRLYATVATCPHKKNLLFRDPQNAKQIQCSGHDAVFDPEGRPLGGPVHHGLERFGIAVDAKGVVRVDVNKRFPEQEWNEKASFIDLKRKA